MQSEMQAIFGSESQDGSKVLNFTEVSCCLRILIKPFTSMYNIQFYSALDERRESLIDEMLASQHTVKIVQ